MAEIRSTLILGGCRSGKSTYALQQAEALAGSKVFVATLQPFDDPEMVERIARHQQQRGPQWTTREAPSELESALQTLPADTGAALVDCLTLWISNLLLAGLAVDEVAARGELLCSAVRSASCPVFLVSNEVGHGVVPDNRLGRDFRDAAGIVNQLAAAACDRVVLMTAGIPQIIKT